MHKKKTNKLRQLYLAINYFWTISYYHTGDLVGHSINDTNVLYRNGYKTETKLTSYIQQEGYQILTEHCVY